MKYEGERLKGDVDIIWSDDFAYAIGLLVTDGCVSKRGDHIDLTSKDREQVETYKKCLGSQAKIGIKRNSIGQTSFRVQFRNQSFHDFLEHIGVVPAKSKIMGPIKIPNRYFFDFLRGAFDGDGTFYSYWDPRWKSSFMFYTVFISASLKHIEWLREEIFNKLGVRGHLTKAKIKICYQLKYAKRDSRKIIEKMYPHKKVACLKRKRLKIEKALAILTKPR